MVASRGNPGFHSNPGQGVVDHSLKGLAQAKIIKKNGDFILAS